MKRKISLLFITIIIGFKSFSQIDTSFIFKEIRELKTDEMINLYWKNLIISDQNIHTFNNPVLQTENLLKVVYFFKYYGFSQNCFYDKTKLFDSNVFEDARTIWIHQPFIKLNLYTFSLIGECGKLSNNKSDVYDPYFMQGILLSCNMNNDVIEKRAYEKIKYNNFKSINIDSLSGLAFEFIKAFREIDLYPIEQGIWNFNNISKMILYKTQNGSYYLDAWNYFKLIKVKENIFQFDANIDGTYFEIDNNGDLLYKDEKGGLLNMYKKIILKY